MSASRSIFLRYKIITTADSRYDDHITAVKPALLNDVLDTICATLRNLLIKQAEIFFSKLFPITFETLDINNIDHVYEYTQNTSVTNVDTLKYDYYVSSVNRANVKSEPVSFGAVELSDAEYVVALIYNLPSTVTLDDVESVNAIRAKYDSLKDADKALEILRANGEDAYILGEVVKSEEGVIIE